MHPKSSREDLNTGNGGNGKNIADTSGRKTRIASVALSGLFLLALFYTLYLAADFLQPVLFALFLSLLLAPVIRLLCFVRIPLFLSAAIGIGASLVLILGFASIISAPLTGFVHDFPTYVQAVQTRATALTAPLQRLASISQQVDRLMQGGGPAQATVSLRQQGVVQVIFSETPGFLAKVVIVIVLSYFLLVYGETFYRKIVYVAPRFEDKRRAVEIAHRLQWAISRYLTSVTLLNLGLGLVVGVTAQLFGLPNSILWGAAAFVLNYIPFLGAGSCMIAMLIACLLNHPTSWISFLPPVIYLAASALESNLITPHVIGRWMTLNPVAILLSFLFWGWLWGIPGMLLAVPILAVAKIFCSTLPSLSSVAEFLGE
ncbi:MAG: AI-2E family transporter [Verrucomicrobia bacterium]|nr:AI-2E family transporter [Verrucomicrobiota bacterium]